MSQKRLRVLSAAAAVASIALAVIVPRQEIGHTEPDTLGGSSQILYDYLIVTRLAVLIVGFAAAAVLYGLSRRDRHRDKQP